ncbi:hypothetical protein EDB85DRAFT_1901720 [Lactarius pseudohatsudake]|nr:hypothetical protein EDB85DRAFT_1901720 [Lactarius pseudohatsudake]
MSAAGIVPLSHRRVVLVAMRILRLHRNDLPDFFLLEITPPPCLISPQLGCQEPLPVHEVLSPCLLHASASLPLQLPSSSSSSTFQRPFPHSCTGFRARKKIPTTVGSTPSRCSLTGDGQDLSPRRCEANPGVGLESYARAVTLDHLSHYRYYPGIVRAYNAHETYEKFASVADRKYSGGEGADDENEVDADGSSGKGQRQQRHKEGDGADGCNKDDAWPRRRGRAAGCSSEGQGVRQRREGESADGCSENDAGGGSSEGADDDNADGGSEGTGGSGESADGDDNTDDGSEGAGSDGGSGETWTGWRWSRRQRRGHRQW